MLIAQLTDMHLKPVGQMAYRRVETAPFLRRAIADIARLDPRPDVVLVTGDLVDVGLPEEYALLRTMLADLPMPFFLIPGNHDSRGPLVDAFRTHAYWPLDGELLNYVVDDYPVRLIAIDTTIPGSPAGEFCARRADWLAARLAEEPSRPTIIFMHHPPFTTGIAHMDRMGLAGADRLAGIVARHPQVERVLCGHLHRPIQVRFAGTLASTAPATAHQVTLALQPDARGTFIMEPPGYQLHWFREGSGIISHTAVIGDFPGPYPFRAA